MARSTARRTRTASSDADVATSNGAASATESTSAGGITPAPAPPLPPAAPLRPGAVPQTFYNPTRIIYAEGAAGQVGPHAAQLGARRVMVVSDPGVVRAGLTEPVVRSIAGAGLKADVYDAVEPDPRIEIVERALDAFTKNKNDLLVAVGGGSAMDTAKACAILATNPGTLR